VGFQLGTLEVSLPDNSLLYVGALTSEAFWCEAKRIFLFSKSFREKPVKLFLLFQKMAKNLEVRGWGPAIAWLCSMGSLSFSSLSFLVYKIEML
jgi:hypothetical protein